MKQLEIILEAALIALVLSAVPGCVLGPIAASQLNSDQMKALKDYNDNADVYACFLVGGPPPAGNIVAIAVPKGAQMSVQFGPDCHAQVSTK